MSWGGQQISLNAILKGWIRESARTETEVELSGGL